MPSAKHTYLGSFVENVEGTVDDPENALGEPDGQTTGPSGPWVAKWETETLDPSVGNLINTEYLEVSVEAKTVNGGVPLLDYVSIQQQDGKELVRFDRNPDNFLTFSSLKEVHEVLVDGDCTVRNVFDNYWGPTFSDDSRFMALAWPWTSGGTNGAVVDLETKEAVFKIPPGGGVANRNGQLFVSSGAEWIWLSMPPHLGVANQRLLNLWGRDEVSGEYVMVDPPLPSESLNASGFGAKVSPDNKWIAVARSEAEGYMDAYNLETGEPVLTPLPWPALSGTGRHTLPETVAWSPDGRFLFVGLRDRRVTTTNQWFWIFDFSQNPVTLIYPDNPAWSDSPYGVHSVRWSEDGEYIFLAVNAVGRTRAIRKTGDASFAVLSAPSGGWLNAGSSVPFATFATLIASHKEAESQYLFVVTATGATGAADHKGWVYRVTGDVITGVGAFPFPLPPMPADGTEASNSLHSFDSACSFSADGKYVLLGGSFGYMNLIAVRVEDIATKGFSGLTHDDFIWDALAQSMTSTKNRSEKHKRSAWAGDIRSLWGFSPNRKWIGFPYVIYGWNHGAASVDIPLDAGAHAHAGGLLAAELYSADDPVPDTRKIVSARIDLARQDDWANSAKGRWRHFHESTGPLYDDLRPFSGLVFSDQFFRRIAYDDSLFRMFNDGFVGIRARNATTSDPHAGVVFFERYRAQSGGLPKHEWLMWLDMDEGDYVGGTPVSAAPKVIEARGNTIAMLRGALADTVQRIRLEVWRRESEDHLWQHVLVGELMPLEWDLLPSPQGTNETHLWWLSPDENALYCSRGYGVDFRDLGSVVFKTFDFPEVGGTPMPIGRLGEAADGKLITAIRDVQPTRFYQYGYDPQTGGLTLEAELPSPTSGDNNRWSKVYPHPTDPNVMGLITQSNWSTSNASLYHRVTGQQITLDDRVSNHQGQGYRGFGVWLGDVFAVQRAIHYWSPQPRGVWGFWKVNPVAFTAEKIPMAHHSKYLSMADPKGRQRSGNLGLWHYQSAVSPNGRWAMGSHSLLNTSTGATGQRTAFCLYDNGIIHDPVVEKLIVEVGSSDPDFQMDALSVSLDALFKVPMPWNLRTEQIGDTSARAEWDWDSEGEPEP